MEAVSRRVQRGSGVDNYAVACCAAPSLECLCVDAGWSVRALAPHRRADPLITAQRRK